MKVGTEHTYSKLFNLRVNPFGETPDARFYFDSHTHNAALSKVGWAFHQGKGFTLLTGEVGTGKTLLSRMLLTTFEDVANTALVLFPRLSEKEMLETICQEFELTPKLPPSSTSKQYLDYLNQHLLLCAAAGKRSVLIVDEAQGLTTQGLETIRLLSNLETEREKLLQIILVGQPELRTRLASPELRQLSQRICVNVNLEPLNEEETSRYIRHRLEIAGDGNLVRFAPCAVKYIHQISGGIPRKINKYCELIILSAQNQRVRLIERKLARATLEPTSNSWLSRFGFGSNSEAPKL